MRTQIGQAVARERLRARLVEFRKQSGLGVDTVTERTHWSVSKLNRIETGAVSVQPVDVQALLQIYAVKDRDEIADLVDLAVVARQRRWWNAYQLDAEYRDFVAYESEASRITVYQALLIPGLLQTEAYARAITSLIVDRKPDDLRVEHLIEVRMRRQSELFARMRGADPPELVALLDGAVLERSVGTPGVMRAQLDHLVDLATHDHVKLVVIPLRHGVHPGLGGVFELLEFAGSGHPDVVFVESPMKDFVVRDKGVTATYHDIVEAIVGLGLTRDAAVGEIRHIRDRVTR
jgi:hypothetical protein